ncbi:MAG: hypothetical protein K2P45_12995 [Eubacterium sp.]|nr:hypothetical protein [Eubacterium sp.]
MLKIGYGCPDDIYFYIDLEFDTLFRMEWLEDEMNKRILREVDHCIYNGFRMQDLEDGYTFAIDDISTGSKALMLVNELEDIQIWGTAFGEENFRAFSLLLGREYTSYGEFLSECIREITAPFAKEYEQDDYD